MALDPFRVGPIFPVDVEREILTIALEKNVYQAKNFLFLAKRVYECLVPTLFKVIIVSGNPWPPPKLRLSRKRLPQYGRHVRHLFLYEEPSSVITEWLTHCPNIVNLGIPFHLNQSHLGLLSRLRLHTLEVLALPDPAPDSAVQKAMLEMYSKLKRLSILGIKDTALFASYFPSLTHLATYPEHPNHVYTELLEWLPSLKVLILTELPDGYSDDDDIDSGGDIAILPPQDKKRRVEVSNDERLVRVQYDQRDTWLRDALGRGGDAWSFADKLVEGRKTIGGSKKGAGGRSTRKRVAKKVVEKKVVEKKKRKPRGMWVLQK